MACRQALKPRLLVPVGLAAGVALYNSWAEQPLAGVEEFSLLGGFLSYKVYYILLKCALVLCNAMYYKVLLSLWLMCPAD